MVEDKDDIPAFASYTGAEPTAAPAAPASAAPAAAATAPAAAAAPAAPSRPAALAGDGTRIVASPYAKKLAAEASVSLQVSPPPPCSSLLCVVDCEHQCPWNSLIRSEGLCGFRRSKGRVGTEERAGHGGA